MRIYTGRSHLLGSAMIEVLRASMSNGVDAHIVVVPRQLTLQTERTLLKALDLPGSFSLQVLSPERLCGRIFEAAGQPDGARIDDRGRVMLARTALKACAERLSLYHGAERRRGFAERCARQLELIRQAGLSPERLIECARAQDGLLAMKLRDLSEILRAYEQLLEGRFQDGESEFRHAMALAAGADFLRSADVTFYGFDLTPPTLHGLMAAVGAVCADTRVFLPLENDPDARDRECFIPIEHALGRLLEACRAAGVDAERVPVSGEDGVSQHPELRRLSGELFAFPPLPAASDAAPRHIQLASTRSPVEECLFAAALCRRLAMDRGWHWSDMLILCSDVESYHQPLKEAFRAYDVPIFLSSSRPAARHALAECLISALRLVDARPQAEDALSLMRSGFMPVTPDEADRLANHMTRCGLRPRALLRPLRRGSEAELAALEPVRARFAAPLNELSRGLKRAKDLRGQLAAVFGFMTDIDAAGRLQARLDRLIEAGLREQAGEEGQVWNRILGALDQMAALMGDTPLPVQELCQTLQESLEAAVIKTLPQSDDAVYAQPADRMVSRPVRALMLLGETDRAGADPDGLLNAQQVQAVSRQAQVYLGSDDAELSRMRRFYLKGALGMVQDYLCVTWPLSGMDNGAQHPGQLVDLIRAIFPGIRVRGGVTGDESLAQMLRGAPRAALRHAARALSSEAEGTPMSRTDEAALAGLCDLADDDPALERGLVQLHAALDRADVADRLSPEAARSLYGALSRQSISRLEHFAACPFSYFADYGLKPDRVMPFELNVKDEGTFFHEAVRAFLHGSMSDLGSISLPEAEARMDAIAERLLDELSSRGPLGDSAVAMAERRRLRDTARTCADVLVEQMQGSRFAPSALETSFGREDGPARLLVDASSGQCVLEGRIDRIDEWAEGGYLRVIDYKRGGKPLNLDAVYHGLSLQLPVYLAAAMKKRGELSAGVYYFTLDEGIVTLQSTDPNDVEKARRERFRLAGLTSDDRDALVAQSPNYEDVLNVQISKSGEFSKNALVTDQAGFEAMTRHALDKAAGILDDIRGGETGIAPSDFRNMSACTWCDLRAACLFDPRLDAGRVRRFPTIRGTEVLRRLKLKE